MAYAQMDSPLPGLTVSPNGCHSCGMRGMGDDSIDFSDLPLTTIDPTEDLSPILMPYDTGMISFPDTIGTEFTSNGDGSYTNIQTGQSVPQSIAQQITAATTGSATAGGVALQSAPITGTLIDPNTGSMISTNNLSVAAQALQSAGQLITAAGKLTAQGQALLNSGNLYNAAPIPAASGFSAAMSSLTSWFSGSSSFGGLVIPNVALIGGVLATYVVLEIVKSSPRKKRR